MGKQSLSPTDLVEAVQEVANALRRQGERKVSERRIELGTNLMGLGNIAAGALLFGQAFSRFPFDFQIASVGLVSLVCLYGLALWVMKGGGRR